MQPSSAPSNSAQSSFWNALIAQWQAITLRQWLLFAVVCTLCIGTTMVASASMPYALARIHQPFHFITLHLLYLLLGTVVATVVTKIPMRLWLNHSVSLWLFTLALLVVVFLFPGVNGSKRWINAFGFTFQPSEFAKLAMAIFTADYVVRRQKDIRFSFLGFVRLALPLSSVILLCVLEPDWGVALVITATVMTIFFLAGAPPKQFLMLIVGGLVAIAAAVLLKKDYHNIRITSFWNPYDDPLGTDLQLLQSLLAFGHGGWFGTGLGQSIQKLEYLPEAHTDFLLAIIAEELGLVGITILFSLLFLLIATCMRIGHRALKNRHKREGYLAYGIATIFLLQTMVNAGMSMGLLPAKGLTLPFISYGGSSLLVNLLMIGILLRIDTETAKPLARAVNVDGV